MRIIIATFIFLGVIARSSDAFSNEAKEYYSKKNLPPKLVEEISKNECKPNLTGFDVCQKVRELADNLAPQLPMKMNSNISLDRVFAVQSMLVLTAILSYDEAYLKTEVQKSGVTMDDLLDSLKKTTIKNVCQQPKSPITALVRLGGQIQYQYYFSDMIYYTSVDINRTSCEIKN